MLLVAVLVLPTTAYPRRMIAPVGLALTLALSVQFARIAGGGGWQLRVPHALDMVLLLAAFVLQLLAFVLVVLRSIARHREARQTLDGVRSSRLRLVEAGDAARRALERDLHDGAQQRVVTASLNLATTRRLITTDPERADSMIAATMTDLHHAAAQLRDVSHGIYPAELTHDGLDGALHALSDAPPFPSPSTPTTSADSAPRSKPPSTSAAPKPYRTPPNTPAPTPT